MEMAKPYKDDMDFAFFAVNFGYTKRDYAELAERDKLFIYKAYENKVVSYEVIEYKGKMKAINVTLIKD